MNRVIFSFFVLGAMPCAALAEPALLTDSQMDRVAAGATVTLNSTVNQTATSASTATCTNCAGTANATASGGAAGASGIGVSSTSQALNVANVHQIAAGVSGSGRH